MEALSDVSYDRRILWEDCYYAKTKNEKFNETMPLFFEIYSVKLRHFFLGFKFNNINLILGKVDWKAFDEEIVVAANHSLVLAAGDLFSLELDSCFSPYLNS